MEKKEAKKQAVPVMKQLARAMSSEEVASVTGASGSGCAPSSGDNTPGHHDPPDFQF